MSLCRRGWVARHSGRCCWSVFWRGGALDDLYQATIVYNLQYSGETYASRWDMARYLLIVRRSGMRGSIRCGSSAASAALVLLCAAGRAQARGGWIPVAWVALACVSIAINGSRDLPQYFLQAAPALALAAGWRRRSPSRRCPWPPRWIAVLLLAAATGASAPIRSRSLPPTSGTTRSTPSAGSIAARTSRGTAGARRRQILGAGQSWTSATFLASHTTPDETVYVFGYSSGAYVYADRRSASRFFWSRPVIVDFNGGDPAYGVNGLPRGSRRRKPGYIVLQERDWPDVQNSAPFFLSQPRSPAGCATITTRLRSFVDGFQAWERERPMTARRFWLWLTAIVLLAARAARLFPAADPPWRPDGRRRLARRRRVGPQRAQQGALRRVAAGRVEPGLHRAGFTALEYASFEAFGVGVRQARLVSAARRLRCR